MKANDVLSFFGSLKLPGGVEGRLRRDRLDKRLGLFITAGGLLVQLFTQAATKENYLQHLPRYITGFFQFIASVVTRDWEAARQFRIVPGLTGIVILAVGLLIYLIVVLRSFIKEYSKEAFKYTFWIDQFSRAEGNPDKDKATDPDGDPLHHLLHHDVMERLSQRIGRLSLIDDSQLDAKEKLLLSSHIHIAGHYTIRLGKHNSRIIHVMPRIRIGPSDMPWILTRPIQFTMKNPPAKAAAPAPANATDYKATPPASATAPEIYRIPVDDYTYVVERVYSNIATEIYKQIKADLITKMRLFPTKYLRAVALYYEAEDFARSNTVDAYDHAVDLYRDSRESFHSSWRAWLARYLVRIPYLPVGASSQIMRVKTEVGYAKCAIYRRRISALSGRYKDPLFEVSEIMNKVVRTLIEVHNKLHRKRWRLDIPWPFVLNSTGLLRVEDIKDQAKLLALLRETEGPAESAELEPIRARIRRRLSKKCKQLIGSNKSGLSKEDLQTLVNELNSILKTEHLHHLVSVEEPAAENIGRVKADTTLICLNRMLFDSAFESAIEGHRLQQQKGQAHVREQSTRVFFATKEKTAKFKFPRNKVLEKEVQALLFESYLVAALAYVELGAYQRATECRELARAISPAISEHDPLYLLAAGSIEPNLMKAASLLGQAAEIDSDFQIAKYLLAERLAFQFLMVSEFTRTRVEPVIKKYEDVLKLNPGNIAALAAQGYLWWLVRDRESATDKFEEGSEIKTVVSETFIGELDYGLARVAAEEGDFETSFYLYTQAMSADPGLASALLTASRFATTYYYEYIGPAMLARYEEFLGRVESFMVRFCSDDFTDVEALIAELNEGKSSVARYILDKWPRSLKRLPKNGTESENPDAAVSILAKAFNKLLEDSDLYEPARFAGYVLNKRVYTLIYKGSNTARLALRNRLLLEAIFPGKLRACFSQTESGNLRRSILNAAEQPVSKKAVDGVYSYVLNDYGNACLNYYLRSGDRAMLDDAISALEESIAIYPSNAVAHFNLSTAYDHKNLSLEKIIECLDTAVKLVPAWPFVRTMSAQQKVRKARDEIDGSHFWAKYFQDRLAEQEIKIKDLETRQKVLNDEAPNEQQTTPVPSETGKHAVKVDNLLQNEWQLRATTADRSQKLDEEITAAKDDAKYYGDKFLENQKELERKQRDFSLRFHDSLANIFADTRLQPLFAQTEMGAVVTTLHGLLLDNAIDWTRMNESDVNALKACAEVLSYSDNNELKSLDCSRQLAMHLLDRYYPEDFDTNAILYQIYNKLGNASVGYAMATLKPVTDYWLTKGTKDFLTIYYRYELSLEKPSAETQNSNNVKAGSHHALLGHVFSRLRRFVEAIAEYRLAIEEDPRCAAHHLRLAELYGAQWQSDKELEELVEAQLLDPDNPEVRDALGLRFNGEGNFYFKRGEWKEAEKQYEAAVNVAPYGDVYHSNLGLALEEQILNDRSGLVLERAIKACQRAQTLAPQKPEYSARLERLFKRKRVSKQPRKDYFGPRGPVPAPITLELSSELIPVFELTEKSELSRLQPYLDWMRDYQWQESGVNLPQVRVCENSLLPWGHYAVSFYESRVRWWNNQVPFTSQEAPLDRRLFIGDFSLLTEVEVYGEETVDPLLGRKAYWIAAEDWPKLTRYESFLLDVGEFPVRHLAYLVSMNLAEFVGPQEVVELVQTKLPAHTEKLRNNYDELKSFTIVLKALLREKVSIEPLAAIYDKFNRLYSADVPLVTVVERIRQSPEVRSTLPGTWSMYKFYRVTEAGESFIESALDSTGPQPVLAMEPEPCQAALTKVREFVDLKQPLGLFAIVTRKTHIRPHLRRLVELEFPHLWILSEEEITEEMKQRIEGDELELTGSIDAN